MKNISVAIFFSLFLISTASSNDKLSFDKISNEISEMQSLFTGNYKEGVVFDLAYAKEYGYSNEAIKISKQLEKLNNKLIFLTKNEILSSKKPNMKSVFSSISLLNYPELSWYMGKMKSKVSSKNINHENTLSTDSLSASSICGSFTNPKPTSSAPTQFFTADTAFEAKQYLINLGFHKTPSIGFGGGWTRAQSYESWMCGVGSFRDHAYILNDLGIRIQDYDGFSPRGEPNPEFYEYVWPYATWVTYVYWWHAYH